MTAVPPRAPRAQSGSRGRQVAIAFGIVAALVVIYVLSLIAVHLLAKSAPPLPSVDFSKIEAEDSVVQVRLEKLDTVANRLTVNVLVYPKDSLYDKNFGVLTTDAAVRLYPDNDPGDLQYPIGKAPAQVSTTIEAHGDPHNMVCRNVVRHCPATQHPPGRPTIWFVGRPSHRAAGVD